jgi:hypothetical protein
VARNGVYVAVLLVAGAAGFAHAAGSRGRPISQTVLLGDGVGRTARFGQAEAIAVADLTKILGRAETGAPVRAGDCDVDATLSWPGIVAYFERGRFVGYSTVGTSVARASEDTMATARGVRVGSTLGSAALAYGSSLTTSSVQGGTWFVTTPYGKVEGFLTALDRRSSRILTIEAGAVGCPAMTP